MAPTSTAPPLPSPALQFYKGGQGDCGESESDEALSPAVYAQLTGFYITGEEGDSYTTSYMRHNWKQTKLMNQFFATEKTKEPHSPSEASETLSDANEQVESSLSTRTSKIDETKALKVIKRFLKRSIRRRRAQTRLLFLWHIINKPSSKRALSRRQSLSDPEKGSTSRPLADMENEEELILPGECSGKENEPPSTIHAKTSFRSPRSVSCIHLAQFSRSFLPRKNSFDHSLRLAYSDDLEPNQAEGTDTTKGAPRSQHEQVDTLIGNIISHSEGREPIPMKELDLPHLDLNSYLSTSFLFSANESFDWNPFDDARQDGFTCQEGTRSHQMKKETRDGLNDNEFFSHESMIELL